jgi:hypothetical protein
MKECVFTICANNYLGLALVLQQSLIKENPDLSFFIFIADEPLKEVNLYPENVIVSKVALQPYLRDEWEEMAFKYNITEFCTSIKPFCFKYMFEEMGFDKIIYLDPDIYVFSTLKTILTDLDSHKVLLTPHITTCDVEFRGSRAEKGLLTTGVYNLGFLGLRKSIEVDKLLNWWGERLKTQCFIDVADGYFTDQRWMDFLPSFFSSSVVSVSRNIGLNVAPWNFFEREVFRCDNVFFVKERKHSVVEHVQDADEATFPLVFIHFSGYDYSSMVNGKIVQNNIPNMIEYDDIQDVSNIYSNFLGVNRDLFSKYIMFKYGYNTFENGDVITQFHRRIFRSLLEENICLSSPFGTGKDSFHSMLLGKHMILAKNEGNIDKFNKLNMPDSSRKLMKVNSFMRIVFSLIGIKNYSLMLRLMRPYSRIENQIHLIDGRFGKILK